MKKKRKCKNCRKLHNNKRFCSNKCKFKYSKKHKKGFWDLKLQSKLGKKGGKKSVEIQKAEGTGFYGMSWEEHSRLGKLVHRLHPNLAKESGKNLHKLYPKLASETFKKFNRLNPNRAKENGKKAAITNKRQRTGMCYDKKIQRIGGLVAAEKNRKNKTSVFDPKIQQMGFEASNNTILFKRLRYYSKPECEIGMNIYYQIEKIEKGKNFQFVVGDKRYDFFILGVFIEVHPYNKKGLDRNGLTYQQYYDERRKVLDDNRYKGYNLIVIS